MNAILLVGHGSLRSDSGASMIRLAARLREQGHAPIAQAAFLNFSRPTLAEGVAKCQDLGATEITVLPYFLIDGVYVQNDLPGDMEKLRQEFPDLSFRLAGCLGYHEQMVAIALDRVRQTLQAAPGADTGLLVLAHGTPRPEANRPILQIARQTAQRIGISAVVTGFLECNQPSGAEAIAQLREQGARRIVALPYFLHQGRHLRGDIPQLLAAARQAHPDLTVIQTPHLGYDLRLVEVLAERLAAAQPVGGP